MEDVEGKEEEGDGEEEGNDVFEEEEEEGIRRLVASGKSRLLRLETGVGTERGGGKEDEA